MRFQQQFFFFFFGQPYKWERKVLGKFGRIWPHWLLPLTCSFFSSAFTKSTVILAVDSVKLIRIYHTLRQQRKMVTHRVGWIICYQSSIIQYMLLQGLWKHSNETRKVLHCRKEEAARIEFPARILIWQSLEAQRLNKNLLCLILGKIMSQHFPSSTGFSF